MIDVDSYNVDDAYQLKYDEVKYLETLASNNNVKAMNILGVYYEREGYCEEALYWLKKSVALDNAEGMLLLAYLYRYLDKTKYYNREVVKELCVRAANKGYDKAKEFVKYLESEGSQFKDW